MQMGSALKLKLILIETMISRCHDANIDRQYLALQFDYGNVIVEKPSVELWMNDDAFHLKFLWVIIRGVCFNIEFANADAKLLCSLASDAKGVLKL